jgi:plastocyanin
MKTGQLIAGLVAALIVGAALGYLIAPPKITVLITTVPITVTQHATSTVTVTQTRILTETVTHTQILTQTVTQTESSGGEYTIDLTELLRTLLANATVVKPQQITQFTIYAFDNYFVPDSVRAPLGATVKFIVINMGRVAHTFDIDELGIHSGPIAPGSKYESPPINLTKPGRFVFYCRYHYGMIGTLEVS